MACHLRNVVFFHTGDFKSLFRLNRLYRLYQAIVQFHGTGDNGNSVCDLWTVTMLGDREYALGR
jgi:hypothetical protein